MKIGVLDYGAGNLKNVCRAIAHLGYQFQLVSTPEDVQNVDKLIIPGVGAFKVAMSQLESLDLVKPIRLLAEQNVPVLGICLGMQLLFEESDEFGKTKGLGLLKGSVKLIPSFDSEGAEVKVPHIGWNELCHKEDCHYVVDSLLSQSPVYFVHSFKACPTDNSVVSYCNYGGFSIPSIVAQGNVIGCQFHPEKSGEIGLKILENFLKR